MARRILYMFFSCAIAWLACAGVAAASEYHGLVTFGGLPLPGATITLTQGATKMSATSDQGGVYLIDNLTDGVWQVSIEMQCFTTIRAEVNVDAHTPAGKWELTLLPLDQLMASSKLTEPSIVAPPPSAPAAKKTDAAQASGPIEIPKAPGEANEQAADGFLVNGTESNSASSLYALTRAFGNSRTGGRNLYNGGLAAIFDNSAFDARPYSLSGFDTPRATYNRITGVATFGGPLRIPRLLPHGPNFFLVYQWTRDHNAATETGLVPTEDERGGDLAGLLNAVGQPVTIYNPATGVPYSGNVVPVSAQAKALLALYPKPNIAGGSLYNYQAPVLDSNHQDALQSRLDKTLGRKDQLYGAFNLQSTRAGAVDLFDFVDTTDTLGMNANINWSHRFSQRLFVYASYRFSRLRTDVTPYFEKRINVAGAAGITGDDQDPAQWGPPALNFSSGITGLADAESSFNRNRTDGFSGSAAIYHGHHNITAGGDLRKQEYNDLFEQDPRGTFTFTGAATAGAGGSASGSSGSDLADFLIGVPDTSSIAFGNADKYLRQPVYDLYATDDWRVRSDLTINAGMRWEYGAPMTELHGRLVNLDIAPGFASAAAVLGSDPVGPLTGSHYPGSLVRPDKLGFEPRIGISWRPVPASTIVVRTGYGVYHDTSVYLGSALQMAQQAPLSKSLSVDNSAACPLTLASAFKPCAAVTADTFAIDPNFRVGYAQTWNLAVQTDLPAALQLTATYLGVKGSRGVQQFLPNTYPIGAAAPCPTCPSGFVYRTSGGDSTRQSGQVQLRRRLRAGLTASLLYTWSKSIDDDSILGGQGHQEASTQSQGSAQEASAAASQPTAAIAQNWLDPQAERALSTFDQRHLLNAQIQYTTGQGLEGGTLMTGWRGRLLKEWTVLTRVTAGSGLPETPVFAAAVPGTGVIGSIRPDLTGAPIYASHAGAHLNASAYAAPAAGLWGTAGRDSITGPDQFSLDASLARTFRPSAKFYLDARVDATNMLNHAVFNGWITTVNSTQFGLPLAASPMRSLQTTLRLRF